MWNQRWTKSVNFFPPTPATIFPHYVPSSFSFPSPLSSLPLSSAMHPFSFSPLILFSVLLFSFFALIASFPSDVSAAPSSSDCPQTFDCGDLKDLSYPFTLRDDCGLPEFRLTCENDSPELAVDSISYRILRLDQSEKTMTLARSDLWNNTCPHEFFNSTLNRNVFDYGKVNEDLTIYYGCSNLTRRPSNLFNCSIDGNPSSDAYFLVGPIPTDQILSVMDCTVGVRVKVLKAAVAELTNNRSMLREVLMEGFSVNYSTCANCLVSVSGAQCGFDSVSAQPICLCDNQPCPAQDDKSKSSDTSLVVGLGVGGAGIVVLSLVIICTVKRGYSSRNSMAWWKRDAKNYHFNAEEIIVNFGSMAPKRYTYSDVKKLTKSFKDKVGQGGFGVVYKGKLPDGRIVAVKVLSKSKDNGEEFINEVASISRTSHVNVVSLLGFCYERSKRALIYEFVPNGSLDGFIYDKGTLDIANCHLENKTLFRIAVGIARGLEYLHSGCRTRILHFDIKPHNILLDENFCPKISDFGLAKLCKTRESIVSMMGTRGTIGYIAPEVFSRTFGGVSHKSDVYSYGMLVLEMVGERKNIEGGISGTSEKYFPHGIYERLEQGETLGTCDVTGDEEDIIKKMIIVSLWCIQTNPSDRPSIEKVIEMLEGSALQSLTFPPKAFLNSPPRPPLDSSTTSLSM